MAGNQTITLKEADGVTLTDVEVLGMGRQTFTASKSVSLCQEDKAVLDAVLAAVDGLEALITTTNANIVAATLPTVAHGTADSGNPVKMGGRARSSENAPVANNARSDFLTDLVGKLITLPYANPENFVSGVIATAMTGTASTLLVAAPAAGLRNYITQITVSNSHLTQGTDILIQDGNGGATLYVIPAAAVWGGAVVTFPTPLRQTTLATGLYCANVTTNAQTKVSASGYKGA